ncbi:putative CFEM domain-containing protein [Colletotrichum sublineola]|uniref:Putative CFEM domain-containing protein n=1 Tax=Colletotrichum sublineola TaxID=1173701 RepID=A0A066XJ73_COLSU|nr:putative CFEM domain-containing protein [Colletotrichum sublineola]
MPPSFPLTCDSFHEPSKCPVVDINFDGGSDAGKSAGMRFAKNVTWTLCGFPYKSQTGTVAGRFTLIIGPAFFVLMRLLAKALRLSSWGADDVMLIIGYVFFAYEILYTLSISTIKASFLFFYIRVFHMVSNTFTLVLWTTQAFNIAFCIAFMIANLAQCRPFSNAWKAWDGKHPGHCINVYAMFVSHAAINIALHRQKVEIMFMFGLGALTFGGGSRCLPSVRAPALAALNP